MKSTKTILPLEDVIEDKLFIIPSTVATDRDQNGEPCVFVSVGGVGEYLPTGKFITIPFKYFCLLKDIGITLKEFEEEYSPI